MFADARSAPFRPSAPACAGRALRRRLARSTATCLLVASILAPLGWSNGISAGGGLDRTAASRIVERTNAIRARHSLPPLTPDPRLARAGESYARTLGIRPWFAHVGPDGSTVGSRAQAFGYSNWEILGENLAMGAGAVDPQSIVEAWMRSPAHRRVILSPDLGEIGVGCYLTYGDPSRYSCVQEFGAE